MRRLLVVLAACSSPSGVAQDAATGSVDGALDTSASPDASGVPLAGFGDLGGMCGVLDATNLASTTPVLFRDTMTFARAYVDPDDRPLLTPGGLHLAETPNAGGSSGLSEIFAYEQLARCELASLLKTETEIVYATPGKITDLEVTVGGHKLGVSVTRAVAFPFGQPYTLATATTLLTRKLQDIQASTMNVSAADKWDKQILAILAWDAQAADVMAQAWAMMDAQTRADTEVILTVTDGDDAFIYTN